MLTNTPIIYEQPLNEHMRVCLRLEHLFSQMLHWMHGVQQWDSRAALTALIEILNVLDRPDLKSKLVKELSRYVTLLTRFQQTPHIDKNKLGAVLRELEHTIRNLHTIEGRLGQLLRDNEFLTIARQSLSASGGGCSFDAPTYYWLQQSPAERISQLSHWSGELKVVQTAVNLTLRLIRQSSAPQLHIANKGFYQAALDASLPCQLVRVAISHGLGVYPETSVGRHGISIRFFNINLVGRPLQTNEDIRFQLTCCTF